MDKRKENLTRIASNPKIVNGQLSMVDSPKGFTLVELLVVITIIGMLAALITGASMMAMNSAKVSRVRMELSQIEMAIEKYKAEFGEYPPDLSVADDVGRAAIVRHIRKRWPRFTFPSTSTNDTQKVDDFFRAINYLYLNSKMLAILENNGIAGLNNKTIFINQNAQYISPIPIWLCGFPDQNGQLMGFNADPQAPFGYVYKSDGTRLRVNDGTTFSGDDSYAAYETLEKKSFLEMQVGKNFSFAQLDPGGDPNYAFPCFISDIGGGTKVPYVYFRGRTDGGVQAYTFYDGTDYRPKYYNFPGVFSGSALGIVVPYARSGDPEDSTATNHKPPLWYNPDKYQIVHPGMDGNFGSVGTSHSHTNQYFDCAYFKAIDPAADHNQIGQADYDNITNFGEPTIESILP